MKKVLIFGSTGMLGSKVLEVFSKEKNFKITATFKNKLILKELKSKKKINFKSINFIKFDAEEIEESKLKLLLKKNDYIVNCIGLIKPYINEKIKSSKKATLINILFPLKLASCSNKKNKIYQIATDCVFSGEKKNYLETSPHDPNDIYGKTKSLGEISNKNFYNLRCSIIGEEIKHNKSLLEWFRCLKENSKITGFSDHMWNGVTTNVFAELLLTIIKKNILIPNSLHLVPKNNVNKFQLLNYLRSYYKRNDVKIKKGKSSKSVNRTLSTINIKLNSSIWKKSVYKKRLTIKEIINNL
jgi:dTDP-4-dehydrorhamnose reductase